MTKFNKSLISLIDKIDFLSDKIDSEINDKQEIYDSKSENWQDSEKWEKFEQDINDMEELRDELMDCSHNLNNYLN